MRDPQPPSTSCRQPAIPAVPSVSGLSPGDASSVAPKGIPVGGTDAPGTMPSGEVAAIPGIGLPIPPTCEKAGENAQLQLKRVATTVAIPQAFHLGSPELTFVMPDRSYVA